MKLASRRVRVGLGHLACSGLVALLAGALVLGVWYPMPYWYLAGGKDLFVLMLGVDVVLGPLLTAVAASPGKTTRHLSVDIAVIAGVQLAGLGYGLYNMWDVRPMAMVAEFKMLRVVIASDIPPEDWVHMPEGMGRWSLCRPAMMGVRPPRDEAERRQMSLLLFSGKMPGSRPIYWQPYEESRAQVLSWAVPLDKLELQTNDQRLHVEEAVAGTGKPASSLVAIPVAAREKGWWALLDRETAQAVGYADLN